MFSNTRIAPGRVLHVLFNLPKKEGTKYVNTLFPLFLGMKNFWLVN